MKSPHFSNFRELMDLWEKSEGVLKIKTLFESEGLILFFKKDKKIYGAPESSRLIIARMKNPEEKEDKDWSKEANFSAYDLEDSSEGKVKKVMFDYKDLKDIQIIDQEKAEKELSKKNKKMPDVRDEDGDDAEDGKNKAHNMINMNDD